MIELKSPAEIERIRQAGRIVARVLNDIGTYLCPGITTGEIDALANRMINSYGGKAAFKGYRGFPGHICTSVNDEVVHGIPGNRVLKEGDIISLDVGVKFNGYFGDAAYTFGVGKISRQASDLLEATQQSLMLAIQSATSGKRLSDISHTIEEFVLSRGYSVVREFVGHGIGRLMHEEPQVPNFGEPGQGPELKAGMVLAIEPMVNMGRPEVKIKSDGWTAVTVDGSLSAHFEHTVLITENEAKILTKL